jgi:DNA polymerase-3 subunit epsilon
MLAQARAVDVTPTGSALEAALLEPDEIKRLRPPYNVALREKDRRLAYWSWTLRHVAPRLDRRHPVGPFLLQAARPPLSALLQLLDQGAGPRAAERLSASVLGVPHRYAPAVAGFRAGVALFVRRHGRWWESGSPVRSVQILDTRLRRHRTQERAGHLGDEVSPPSERWSAEGVAATLEEVVRRGAHVIRRARWLCALGECSLAWAAGEGDRLRRGLVLSRGVVVSRHELDHEQEPPLPPGSATPLEERQRAMDLATYDRLSVLSRELKALVAGPGAVVVRLGPTTVLDREALARALRCL